MPETLKSQATFLGDLGRKVGFAFARAPHLPPLYWVPASSTRLIKRPKRVESKKTKGVSVSRKDFKDHSGKRGLLTSPIVKHVFFRLISILS